MSILFKDSTDNTFIQFFRYLFVGGGAFIADYGTLLVLVEIFGLNDKFAAVIAFIFGLAANYAISKLWVFNNSVIGNRFTEFFIFAVIGVIGLGINIAVIAVFDDVLAPRGVFGSLPEDKYYMIGKLVSTAVVFVWNFAARKFFIFRSNRC